MTQLLERFIPRHDTDPAIVRKIHSILNDEQDLYSDYPGQHGEMLSSLAEMSTLPRNLYLGRYNAEAVAVAAVYRSARRAGYLETLAVDKNIHDRSLGIVALSEIVDIARQDNALVLITNSLTNSVGFYQKAGFVVDNQTDHTHVLMHKQL